MVRGGGYEMLLWWISMEQESSSADLGRETSEDDWGDELIKDAASRRLSIFA